MNFKQYGAHCTYLVCTEVLLQCEAKSKPKYLDAKAHENRGNFWMGVSHIAVMDDISWLINGTSTVELQSPAFSSVPM